MRQESQGFIHDHSVLHSFDFVQTAIYFVRPTAHKCLNTDLYNQEYVLKWHMCLMDLVLSRQYKFTILCIKVDKIKTILIVCFRVLSQIF